jgi:hypothetical protein
MPIKIIKRGAAPAAEDAPAEPPSTFVKQVELIESHCKFLAACPGGSLGHKDEILIAALLGFGSKAAQDALWHDGRVLQEWVKIAPWYPRSASRCYPKTRYGKYTAAKLRGDTVAGPR